jgi:solute carrier family 35 (UDP-sugar transporter), member A1/2/3
MTRTSRLLCTFLVIQNNLQFVAASNLDAATFQVTYQMKILTTAGFSVLMLRKKLSAMQWMSLLFLAIGVAVVQIQSISGTTSTSSAGENTMDGMKGLLAVMAACMTSGLAGVYFEMVLKNTQADLWIRNVQLSLFSLLPALMPILFSQQATAEMSMIGWIASLFDNFGPWAWATVFIQVLGGLVTAMVIKYSDNILKGFATSLSIVASFLASVVLFNQHMSLQFIIGSTIVLNATTLYNQNPKKFLTSRSGKEPTLLVSWNDGMRSLNGIKSPAVEKSTGDEGVLYHSGSRTSSGSSISVVLTPPSPITEYP